MLIRPTNLKRPRCAKYQLIPIKLKRRLGRTLVRVTRGEHEGSARPAARAEVVVADESMRVCCGDGGEEEAGGEVEIGRGGGGDGGCARRWIDKDSLWYSQGK